MLSGILVLEVHVNCRITVLNLLLDVVISMFSPF